MKTKGHRISGCFLLVCAIGLAVGICASVANSKIPLSDNAMSSVYGGCGPCATKDNDGCRAPTINCETKDPNECTGTYRTSCKQEQKECKVETPELCDDSFTKACFYKTFDTSCCEIDDDTEDCENVYQYTCSCSGSRDWCIGELQSPC